MDAATLPTLTRRQEQILAGIVRAYTDKAEPVSSKFIAETFDLSVSAATIRNEMVVLEELGYIAQPHTSAGRVPTEAGYRYYVSNLLSSIELPTTEQSKIAERMRTAPMGTEQWMRYAANALARTSQAASLVTAPSSQTGRFKHIELISVQGRLVLMVLILQGGGVHQRMLNLAETVSQATLSDLSNRLNSLCHDLTARDLTVKAVGLPLLDREVLELAAEVMERAGTTAAQTVYRDGLSDVLQAFPAGEGAQQAVRVFEERQFLNVILDEFLGPLTGGVQVIIAGDGKRDEISQLSLVLSRYGQPDQLSGAIGLIGPTHLNYGRAISAVRYVSTMMTNMLVSLYNSTDAEDGDPTAGS